MFMLHNGKLYVRCDYTKHIVEAVKFLGACVVVGIGVGMTICITVGTFKMFCKIIGA